MVECRQAQGWEVRQMETLEHRSGDFPGKDYRDLTEVHRAVGFATTPRPPDIAAKGYRRR
jgi:hypothetical protein